MRHLLFLICFSAQAVVGQHLDLLHRLPYNDVLSDIWGYTDGNGREYALVGLVNGVSVVDLGLGSTAPRELFRIPGPSSIWWDLKTWDGYGYVTNETDSGLLIMNLRQLPDALTYQYVQSIDGYQLNTAHNLFIDEQGVAYVFGANLENGGAMMLDLTQPNRFAPDLLGFYSDGYIHDGFVRGDTLWAAEIYNGYVSVIDVSDKTTPTIITTFDTPDRFSHNCWLSDNGRYLITTDERPNGRIGVYDVSDLSDVQLLDSYVRDRGSELIPHNTYWLGDYIITSYYRQGVTIVEATDPKNVVETGWYDTSPFPAARGFEGCWGVYPYLPGGRIIASDREQGLFVLAPTFTKAARLEGIVVDQQGQPIPGAIVTIENTPGFDQTDIKGLYSTGAATTGVYDVRVYREGCNSITLPGVHLVADSTIFLPITYTCTPVGLSSMNPQITGRWLGDCLQISGVENPASLEIIDLQGRTVWREENSSLLACITIPVPAGTYQVAIRKDEGTQLIRTVKP